jgi:hypothetical protein
MLLHMGRLLNSVIQATVEAFVSENRTTDVSTGSETRTTDASTGGETRTVNIPAP